ncbi:hypothetical protein ABPG72_013348 [Tetrahymena utriculariae]
MFRKHLIQAARQQKLFVPLERREFFSFFKSKQQKFKDNVDEADKYFKLHQYSNAVDFYKEALKYDDHTKPQADKIIKNMALAYFQMNQIDQAIQCYMELQEKYPNDQNIQIAIGLIYGKSQSPEKALKVFEEVLEKDPNNRQILFQVAIYCEQLHLIDKAVEYYQKCIQLNPQDYEAYLNIGYIHIRKLDDCEKALDFLNKANELDGNNIDLMYNIGMCHFQMKNHELALQYLKKCLDIDPSFHDAKRNIRYIKQFNRVE